MRHIALVTALLGLLAAGGCASHHALAAPSADLIRAGVATDPEQISRIERSLTDEDIARRLDADVSAKLPTSVAIAKLEGAYHPRLKNIGAAELERWDEAFADQKLLTGALPVTHIIHGSGNPTLHSLRQAAAKMNCELLLVYLQDDSSVNNLTDASVLYWTIVGLWTAPGNELQHETVMQAALLDTRTGMVLGTATGDSHLEETYPAAFEDIRRAELAEKAPAEALKDLQKGVRPLMAGVVNAALARRPG